MPNGNERDANSIECPKCGAKVPAGEDVCVVCDHKLTSREKDTVQKTEIICSNCGAQVSEGDNACPVCDTPVVTAAESICASCGESMPEDTEMCPICGAMKELPEAKPEEVPVLHVLLQ